MIRRLTDESNMGKDIMPLIYYEAYPDDDDNPEWWLEDSFEECFPSIYIDDDEWDEHALSGAPIKALIDNQGE